MDIPVSSERRVFSQNGEDGVIEHLLRAILPVTRVFVEVGVGNGGENNTRKLAEQDGWSGYWFALGPVTHIPSGVKVVEKKITSENIEPLLGAEGVPKDLGLLSIDVDGIDYWLWKAVEAWRPQVVVIEYNGLLAPPLSQTIAYDPEFAWNGSRYFGASLCALARLAIAKGYSLFYCESRGVN